MYFPALDEIQHLILDPAHADKRYIPVVHDVVADLDTPVSAFLKLRQDKASYGGTSFLLESVSLGENLSRYSFLGTNAFRVLTSGPEEKFQGDPLVQLELELRQYRVIELPEVPLPFVGGAVGYCSFESVRHFEPKLAPVIEQQENVLHLAESIYMLFDAFVVFDHAFLTLKIIALCPLFTENLASAYAETVKKIQTMARAMCQPLVMHSEEDAYERKDSQFNWTEASNVGKIGYMDFVTNLKQHIRDGDIFQAVPSQRLNVALPPSLDPFALYRQMRTINPSPYMYFLELGPEFQIIGASPEMLIKVTPATREMETHPIAGTRPRGATRAQDQALAQELLADEKERAEHLMLVDLGRNDLGKVAEPGSVHVPSLMQIENYSHVMHIVSIVKATLRRDLSVYDAYRSVFPAGTVSGAPKIRAMELVCGLEHERRGVYAGSVGYFSFHGGLDTAIAIRTLVVKNQRIYAQAGGGIVHDSDPEMEYQETMNKLGSVVRTIEQSTSAKRCKYD